MRRRSERASLFYGVTLRNVHMFPKKKTVIKLNFIFVVTIYLIETSSTCELFNQVLYNSYTGLSLYFKFPAETVSLCKSFWLFFFSLMNKIGL